MRQEDIYRWLTNRARSEAWAQEALVAWDVLEMAGAAPLGCLLPEMEAGRLWCLRGSMNGMGQHRRTAHRVRAIGTVFAGTACGHLSYNELVRVDDPTLPKGGIIETGAQVMCKRCYPPPPVERMAETTFLDHVISHHVVISRDEPRFAQEYLAEWLEDDE